MKTVFITSFHPLISRNILFTDIIPELLRRNVRVVLPTPSYKEEYLKKHFGSRSGIHIAVVPYNKPSAFLMGRLFKRLFQALLVAQNIKVYYRRKVLAQKGYFYRAWYKFVHFLGEFAWVRKAARVVLFYLSPSGFFVDALDAYRPDLLVVTDLHNENDVAFIQDAKRRGIPVVGIVRSWDHLTSKGLLKVIPEFIFSSNDIIKNDAIQFHGVPEERIKIVGIPHYDKYFRHTPCTREEFARRIGADPQKKFVLHAPFGSRYTANNTVDRDVIHCISKTLPSTHQLIVRFPPTDSVDVYDFTNPPLNVVYDRPGVHLSSNPSKFIRNELTLEDDEWLRNTIYHSDVVISGLSTMTIDAAIFDKPVIIVGFDGYCKVPYDQSVRRYFEYDYFRPIFRSGGARLAESVEDFKKFLSLYLEHPETDADGRRRIVEEQCGFTDGKSSERISGMICEIIGA